MDNDTETPRTMTRKNVEFGNAIPRKFCHLEGNFNFWMKEYLKNSGKFDHIPGKLAFFLSCAKDQTRVTP